MSQVLDRPEPHGGRPGDRFDPLMALPVSILSTLVYALTLHNQVKLG